MNSKAAPRPNRRRTLKPASGPLVAVARLDGLFGIRGELKCRATSAGAALIEAGRRFSLDERGEREVTIAQVRRHHGRFVVTLEDARDAIAAQAFVGCRLFVARESVALEAGEFLEDDLAGVRLLDEAGRELGRVVRVEHYPASDCLVVSPGNALVPMVREFILRVDLETGTMTVRLPDGLLDAELAEEA
jgi:16S rRNA processing protein RimM